MTYSEQLRLKQMKSCLFDYEIALLGDHIHQGCYQNSRKHGEGISIMNNGTVAVGLWDNGKLDGYALFLCPHGGKVHTHYNKGALDGWAIIEFDNNFEILYFENDAPKDVRVRYDDFEELWTEVLFKNGRIDKVNRIEKCKDYELPTFLNDPQLAELYTRTIMKGQTDLKKVNLK